MAQSKARILLVEDDKSLGSVTKDYLSLAGYDVHLCEDGKSAFESFQKKSYDLCILDVMLPKMDGFTLAENIRKMSEATPILFLTSKSGKEDRVQGFKIGGDDFIVKPFDIEELVLRIEVFLKRTSTVQQKNIFEFGTTVFDYGNYELKVKGKKRKLTTKEAELLFVLCNQLNKISKRESLLLKVWGSDDYFLGRSLDVFIFKLRKYLEPDPHLEIENHHGIGFKLVVKK